MNKEKLQDLIQRLSHPQTITAIIGAVGIIANALGLKFDADYANNIALAIFTLMTSLGILNNPSVTGSYIPLVSKSELPELVSLGKEAKAKSSDTKIEDQIIPEHVEPLEAIPTEDDMTKELENNSDSEIKNYSLEDRE